MLSKPVFGELCYKGTGPQLARGNLIMTVEFCLALPDYCHFPQVFPFGNHLESHMETSPNPVDSALYCYQY